MERQKVYFARPIHQYNSPQDKRDIELLEKMGYEVVDPNTKELSEKYKEEGMEAFYKVIENVDGLAFRAFPDMAIGAGVAGEIQKALDTGKWIVELPTVTSKRILSVGDTRVYLNLLGAR